MTRILIVGLVAVVVLSASVFYIFLAKPKVEPPVVAPQGEVQKAADTLHSTKPTVVASASALDARVSSLEATVADLQKQLNAVKNVGQNATVLKAPLYIPLGSGASSSSLTWQTSDALQVTIDPANYPGYSSMVLEMGLQVFQGNGQAFSRLYDDTDAQPISGSDVSSTSQNFIWVTSSGFRLPAGSKTYKLQLYSNTTYQALEQNARIKVNF